MAAPQQPDENAAAQIIDTAVDQQNATAGITAAPQADPDTLLRRTTLDLAGRIPTSKER
ncbi:MAG: DUF1549 domain-containing protein, partial [Planctomycetaceae bacterium]